jgi:Rrf2 family protein
MAVNTQFSIAVHIMVGLGFDCGGEITSGRIAQSVNTSPSFIRRTLAKLAKAGLIRTARGKSGSCRLEKKPADISLLDIYRAVDAPKVFAIHHYAELKPCPVSCNIKGALDKVLSKSQKAMEKSLAETTLGDVIAAVKKK